MSEAIKVVTYNTWHGLTGEGLWQFGELESSERRHQRLTMQIEALELQKPDIVCLQELNPVDRMANYFAQRLGMKECHQVDNSGIKVLGMGIPWNLMSGLGILVRPPWRVVSSRSVHLSGDAWSFNRDELSLQVKESRYALIAELKHPQWGRVVVANVHLHHGLGPSSFIQNGIQKLVDGGELSTEVAGRAIRALKLSDERRVDEVKKLLAALDEFIEPASFRLIVGDLNSRPESPCVELLQKQKFVDSWVAGHGAEGGHTWNPELNKENFKHFRDFKVGADLSVCELSPAQNAAVMKVLYDSEFEPKRIDYILIKAEQKEIRVNNIDFLKNSDQKPLLASDHLGLRAGLELVKS